MTEYYVLLGDVVHSRAIEDREGFQERLADICGRFTAERRDDVYGNFKILKGIDEFGGVLQSLANLYEVVTAFHEGLRPHEVRIVVASGGIDVGLTSFDVEKMDGAAFHRATERVEELEDESMVFDLLLGAEGGAGLDEDDRSRIGATDFGRVDANLGRAIADEVNLLLELRSGWTDRQREVVAVGETVETQTAAAKELDVTQQAVSNVLAGAKWPLVHSVEERLRETLGSYAEGRAEVRREQPTPEGTLGEWLSTLDWDDVVDDVPTPVRSGVETALPDDVLESPDGVDAFLDHLREAAEWEPDADSLHLEVARFLRDHGHPTLTLEEYESVLDRNPDDVAVYLEYAGLAVEEGRHREALWRLLWLLEAAADAGTATDLADQISGGLGDVVEPVVLRAEDSLVVRNVLDLLVSLGRRTADPAGEDVRRWGLVQHARLLDEPHEGASLSGDDTPGRRATDSYSTGLGYVLAGEPEAAVSHFEDAWESDTVTEFYDYDRDLSRAAGVALLGCERVLGPAILDVTPDDLQRGIEAMDAPLRAPAAWLLAHLVGDEPSNGRTGDDSDGTVPVEPDPDHQAFAELEARAFETLYDLIERWGDET